VGSGIKAIEIELAALVLADPKKRANLLVCADLDGVEVFCQSYLEREITKEILESLGILQYFDGINREVSDIPIYIGQPWDVDYKWVSRHLARSRPRVVNLLTSID